MKRLCLFVALFLVVASVQAQSDAAAEDAKRRVLEGLKEKPVFRTRGVGGSKSLPPSNEVRRGFMTSRGPHPTLVSPEQARVSASDVADMRPAQIQDGTTQEVRVDARRKTEFADMLFAKNKAAFADTATASRVHGMAEGMIEVLKANASQRFLIEGHTCDLGADDFNERLSWLRAEVVRLTLIGHGVPAANLQTMGCGEREAQGLASLPPDLEEPRKPYRKVAVRVIVPD